MSLEKSVTIVVSLNMEGMWVYSATTGEELEQTEDPQRRNEGGRGTGMILTKRAGVVGKARAGGKEYSNERAVLLFDRKTACAK